MAQAALKQDYYYDNPTEAEIAAIDTKKIPRVCGAPAPRNKAEFLALMAEAEQQIANGQYYTFDEVFDKLNAKYHFKIQHPQFPKSLIFPKAIENYWRKTILSSTKSMNQQKPFIFFMSFTPSRIIFPTSDYPLIFCLSRMSK